MAIEAKLQRATASSFLQKRDAARQSHVLAVERLRLVQEEADAMTKTVAAMSHQLEDLKIQGGFGGGGGADSDNTMFVLSKLHREVEKLTRDVRTFNEH